MATTSQVRPIGGTLPTGPLKGGAVWLKWARKADGAPLNDVVMVKEQGEFAIQRLAGNGTQIRITAAATPGPRGEEVTVQCYAVPGDFTPTVEVPYPVGTPVSMVKIGTQGAANSLDHIDFYATINVVFSANKAQVVLLHSSGSYDVIPYDQEALAQLSTANITSGYAPNRTGFTAGDTVTVGFSATGGDVNSLAVWPYDVPLVGGLPDPLVEPGIFAVTPAGPTGSASVQIAALNANAYSDAGKLWVAAVRYGQWSTPVETTGAFVFDERLPQFSPSTGAVTVSYPPGQSAIKGSEQATVTITGLGLAASIVANFSATMHTAPVGTPPYAVTAGSVSFDIERGAVGHNGRTYLQITATNSNNGKTAAAVDYVPVDVQDTVFADPVLTVNMGSPVSSSVLGTVVPVTLTSEVELANPGAWITTPGLTISSWSTSNGGYTWTASATVLDTAVRSTAHTATASGTPTAAGSALAAISGTYKISGFEERAFVVAPFVAVINLGSLPVDYPAGLVVKDPAFQNTGFLYNAGLITLTNALLVDNNAAGNMPIYISQLPSP